MAKYELVVVWETGEKDIIPYSNEEEAKVIEYRYRMAFGNQIQWTGIREVRV